MLEKNQRFKSLLYVLADAALLFIGFLLANYIRFNYVRYFEPGGAGLRWPWPGPAQHHCRAGHVAGARAHLLGRRVSTAPRGCAGLAERCTKIAVINAAGLLIFIGALYLMHLDDYSRIVLALFYILGTAGVVIERMILRWVDRARRRKGLGLRHILLVGGGKSAALYLRALGAQPLLRLRRGRLSGQNRRTGSWCALHGQDMMRCPPGSTRLPWMRSSWRWKPTKSIIAPRFCRLRQKRRAHHDGTVLQRLSARPAHH